MTACEPARTVGAVRWSRSPELAVIAWGAGTFGAVLASYTAFRPLRDALVVDENPEKIPWLFSATFVVTGVIAPIWGGVVARGPRRVVLRALHVLAGSAVLFYVLVRAELAPVAVGRALYVWSAVFNLFAVSIVWSLFADILGTARARRAYGPIAAGGTIGTLVGPLVTRAVAETIGVAGVLLITAALLEVAVLGVARVRAAAAELPAEAPAPPDRPIGGGALDGIAHVARSPYLAAIVGYVLCTATAATFLYLQQAQITHAELATKLERVRYFADLDIYVAIATLALQLAIVGRLLGRFGPGVVLAVLPLVQATGISLLAIAPSLTTLAVVQILGRSATHGLTRPARELLFTVLARADKYRAKNVIDVVAYRFGDVGSGWLFDGLTVLGGSGALVAVALPVCAGWFALAVALGVGFRKRALVKETP